MKNVKMKNFILFIQMALTLFGTILAVVLLFRELQAPSFLGVIGSIAYLVTYLSVIVYTVFNYNKKENIYFQGVIYAYAALIGIQILQSGNYISDYGLAPNVALFINCLNLIIFANIIKFADKLDSKKIAISYMIVAVLLKLGIEISLIIKMIAFVQIIHILMSLAIPILGITILIAYISRLDRLDSEKNN